MLIRQVKKKLFFMLFTISVFCCPLTVWAGEWIQEDGTWYYEVNADEVQAALGQTSSQQTIQEQTVLNQTTSAQTADNQESRSRLKGWNRINNRWYCLDEQTGAWIQKPAMTAEAAGHLLENRLQDLNLYQDEEEELVFKVDYEDSKQIQLSVGYMEKPDLFHRLNQYTIDRKKGTADPVVGKETISLW